MPDLSTFSLTAVEDNCQTHDFEVGVLHPYKTQAPEAELCAEVVQNFRQGTSSLRKLKDNPKASAKDLERADDECQRHIDRMYTILHRHRKLVKLLQREVQEKLKHADQYELHKQAHTKLDAVLDSLDKVQVMSRWMDWELNGIAETDDEGKLLYDIEAATTGEQ